ncbi:hypothetical protein [uncultured Nitratireductor sp.]|uniref:hypothetical protein n=1 Tax=uncultured Nitratireductor sp. TaxID=520953 RepID=UPI0025FD0AE1|nr:hypothetical protein [uncultured Nitratireductor sp.]
MILNIMRALLSGWMLPPCMPLMMAGYLLVGIVAMAADDSERDPTPAEMRVILFGFLPTIWFAAILAQLAGRVWRCSADTK